MGAACHPISKLELWPDELPEGIDETIYAGVKQHKVQLLATCLGVDVPGFRVFHTSVVVEDTEYYFGPSGVNTTTDCGSHKFLKNAPTMLTMGYSPIPGQEMRRVVSSLFRAGSYDALRKNCNSFSDCALYYLLGNRLEWRYRGLDQVGAALNRHDSALMNSILEAIGVGTYVPNPEAVGFDIEESLRWLNDAREVRRTHMGGHLKGRPAANKSGRFAVEN
ncbi:unnamed protein product [Prorocentrum cordatum]|uniref:PPPDE domain-containing protein n=1 Tax=Prorocentrum cordatum TaxID=2364126 RepID=A0ABN9SB21_9DINO|nr:unnamed protein product [Polarella glacialis]|mmetsp:Transcript_82221/g.222760  ORF Transcript_82221/g.222760 Transcript_82221/m.222760 type:complete len:221 (+) Transcript_82221:77-739(+)